MLIASKRTMGCESFSAAGNKWFCARVKAGSGNPAPAPPSAVVPAGSLEKEPGPPLGLVEPNLEKACRGDILVFLADAMHRAKLRPQMQIVIPQFGKHVLRLDELGIVVLDALLA